MTLCRISYSSLLSALVLAWLLPVMQATAQEAVLSLPEIVVTSFRGEVGNSQRELSGPAETLTPPLPGQPFIPVHVRPGTRLYVSGDFSSHAMISLPGAGGCMIASGSSFRLPAATEKGMTVSFDAHIYSNAKLFLNINAAEMAKQKGAVFRFKNKYQANSAAASIYSYPKVVFSTQGGRFFVTDAHSLQSADAGASVNICTVGVFDGSLTVEEITSNQKMELKPGNVLVIKPGDLGQPRPPTKAELSYDIGCKIAGLGREVPPPPPTFNESFCAHQFVRLQGQQPRHGLGSRPRH